MFNNWCIIDNNKPRLFLKYLNIIASLTFASLAILDVLTALKPYFENKSMLANSTFSY